MTKDEMQLVVRAIDEASGTLRQIRGEVHQAGQESGNAAKQVETLGSKLTSLGQQVKLGFAIGIGQDIFGAITSGVEKLVGLIPQAVSAGDAWATQVAQIGRETGMSAEQTSLLLGVMERADVPLENTARLFALLGKNLSGNEQLFKRLGIATRDSDGNLLDTFTIVDNLRHKFSQYGASLTETAAGQKLLGRTGYEMLQFLQLSDGQFRLFAEAAKSAGEVLSEDVVAGAERFNRTWSDLWGTIKGLQTGIFAALEAPLETFVDGFSKFIKAHMQEILTFVVNAANFVLGVIGGLLGIDFGQITLAQQVDNAATKTDHLAAKQKSLQSALAGAKAGEDALTKSLNAQIAAIDKQIKAIDDREAKRRAATERARLSSAIEAAQANLADLEGNAPYTAGLSAAEAELAIQKHNQDVLDARKALSDAIAALNEFDTGSADDAEKKKLEAQKTALQQQLQAHHKAHAGMTGNVTGLVGTTQTGYKAMTASASAAFTKMNADANVWRDKGVAFSNDVKGAINAVIDTLLGTMHYDSAFNTYSRSGGLLGALGTIARFIGDFAHWLGQVADFIHSIIHDRPPGALPPMVGPNHAMGGYVPPGTSSRVGEYASEMLYARPGGGVDVYSNPGAAAPSSSGGGHEHPIYLDGYLVGRAIDQRNARTHRSTTIRPIGAT